MQSLLSTAQRCLVEPTVYAIQNPKHATATMVALSALVGLGGWLASKAADANVINEDRGYKACFIAYTTASFTLMAAIPYGVLAIVKGLTSKV